MQKRLNNYAFIDSQNVNRAVEEMGWQLDFKRFRVYLREKYGVTRAYLFLGYLPHQENMYRSLQAYGYVLVFKPVLPRRDGDVKGNVDAELVLQAMIDYQEYEQAVIATSDGDFYCLVKYLYERHKLVRLLVPNRYKYSALLRRAVPSGHAIAFMNDLRHRVEYIKHPRQLPEVRIGGST